MTTSGSGRSRLRRRKFEENDHFSKKKDSKIDQIGYHVAAAEQGTFSDESWPKIAQGMTRQAQ